MKKVIVLSVIALFIVVGFQPALAVEPKLSADNKENEEDCDCQAVSDINLNRLDEEFDRLESYSGLLSLLSKCNTEIKELSNRISTLSEMDGENDSICSYLLFRRFIIMLWGWALYDAMEYYYENGNLLLYKICEYLIKLSEKRYNVFDALLRYYDCETPW